MLLQSLGTAISQIARTAFLRVFAFSYAATASQNMGANDGKKENTSVTSLNDKNPLP